MIKQWVILIASLSLAKPLLAFPCYFTLAKSNCWANYDVKVDVLDAVSRKILTTVQVAKGQTWTRQSFNCQPGQKLIYFASFQPSFWQSEKGKTYAALRFWALPSTVTEKDSAWEIPVCYPDAFSAVPFPPDAAGDCKCDLGSIPPIKPK